MTYPNDLDVARGRGKSKKPVSCRCEVGVPIFSLQLNTAHLSCLISMISLPVYDIYHTQVDYRARKDWYVILYRVELF